MKKLIILGVVIAISLTWIGCTAGGNDPGRAYMPDMYYSRAYEAYNYNNIDGELDSLKSRSIFYNALPVPGTIARGDNYNYHMTEDSNGLAASNSIKNPLDTLQTAPANMKEAERLYLINCGICHGPKLDGNGPLWNNGEGPYPAKPQDLIGYGAKLSDGHIYHVITYGIRSMGSYASQLSPIQRWWVIKYIRSKQGGAATDSTAAPAAQTATATATMTP